MMSGLARAQEPTKPLSLSLYRRDGEDREELRGGGRGTQVQGWEMICPH